MFRKEPAAVLQWGESNIHRCAERQRQILAAAAQAVRPGGRLVYSTCTFAPEENECQIAWFLQQHPDYCLETWSPSFGRPAFSWDRLAPFMPPDIRVGSSLPLEHCRRIHPGQGGEGHFIALLRRKDGPEISPPPDFVYAAEDTDCKQTRLLYEECFSGPFTGRLMRFGETIRLLPEGLPSLAGLNVLGAGVAAAERRKGRVEPCHPLYAASSAADCRSCLDLGRGDPRLTAFLRGETVDAPGHAGWTAVAADGIPLGFGKATGGILKNRYPKGLRLRSWDDAIIQQPDALTE